MLALDFRMRLSDFALDVKLAAPAGVIALFGRSGAGKTSIIRAIAGLARPADGRIAIGDTVLFDSAARIDIPPERRRVGYVFQDARLFPHLGVADNLRYGMRRARNVAPEIGFDAVVELLGIAHSRRPPPRDPVGRRTPACGGRPRAPRPATAPAEDEPLASLDAARKAEVLPYLDRLHRTLRLPIVYVSHALDEVIRLADTLALVDAGRIAACGPVGEITSRIDLDPLAGRFEAGTVLDAQVASHDAQYLLTKLAFDGGVLTVPGLDAEPGTTVRVQIRARDVMIATRYPEGISARNILAGRIVELDPERGAYAEILIAAGQHGSAPA